LGGLASYLVSQVSQEVFQQDICFIFVLEDPEIEIHNYKFLVEMGISHWALLPSYSENLMD